MIILVNEDREDQPADCPVAVDLDAVRSSHPEYVAAIEAAAAKTERPYLALEISWEHALDVPSLKLPFEGKVEKSVTIWVNC